VGRSDHRFVATQPTGRETADFRTLMSVRVKTKLVEENDFIFFNSVVTTIYPCKDICTRSEKERKRNFSSAQLSGCVRKSDKVKILHNGHNISK
jgi:hypothetical protein